MRRAFIWKVLVPLGLLLWFYFFLGKHINVYTSSCIIKGVDLIKVWEFACDFENVVKYDRSIKIDSIQILTQNELGEKQFAANYRKSFSISNYSFSLTGQSVYKASVSPVHQIRSEHVVFVPGQMYNVHFTSETTLEQLNDELTITQRFVYTSPYLLLQIVGSSLKEHFEKFTDYIRIRKYVYFE